MKDFHQTDPENMYYDALARGAYADVCCICPLKKEQKDEDW